MSTRDRALEQTQEDIFRERALVLARAGESVQAALEKMKKIEEGIEDKLEVLGMINDTSHVPWESNDADTSRYSRDTLFDDINRDILKYNNAREYAKLRYYYLIVTREALGLRRHKMVEEFYKIPSKKDYIKRSQWTNT
jgi:hypothetical protein